MRPAPESVGSGDRTVIAIVWILIFVFGGLAAIATASQAFDDSGFNADGYDHDPSTIVGFYALGLIDGLLTISLLFWLLPRWRRGRERTTAQRGTRAIALGALVLTWFCWFFCGAVLSVGS
jgi:uncharacterized membrane protein